MERVSFSAPAHANDLRIALSGHTAAEHAFHQLAFVTLSGDARRVIRWLTKADAHSRAQLLRSRGYKGVAVSTMG